MTRNRSFSNRDLRATLGDKHDVLTLTFTDGGSPINVSSRTYTAQIRPAPGATAVVDMSVDTTDAATGVIVLGVDLTDVDATVGDWWWDCVEVDGSVVTTIVGGMFTIEPRYTTGA